MLLFVTKQTILLSILSAVKYQILDRVPSRWKFVI